MKLVNEEYGIYQDANKKDYYFDLKVVAKCRKLEYNSALELIADGPNIWHGLSKRFWDSNMIDHEDTKLIMIDGLKVFLNRYEDLLSDYLRKVDVVKYETCDEQVKKALGKELSEAFKRGAEAWNEFFLLMRIVKDTDDNRRTMDEELETYEKLYLEEQQLFEHLCHVDLGLCYAHLNQGQRETILENRAWQWKKKHGGIAWIRSTMAQSYPIRSRKMVLDENTIRNMIIRTNKGGKAD